jgi:RNA polymerase-binding transcription factor DksA
MALEDDSRSERELKPPEYREVELRQRLEEALCVARDKVTQLDNRLDVKGDYGHGRGDPLVVNWEMNLALRQRFEKEVEYLEAALSRMDEGEHGVCQVCGGGINPERQEALPHTTLCMACARSGQAELVL